MIPLSEQNARHQSSTHAPDAARCPRCGTWSPRNEIRRRSFWQPSLEEPTILDFDTGCYICPVCPKGSRWFRLMPAGFEGAGQYTEATCDLVVDMVRTYKMAIEGATAFARKRLHLPMLHPSTVLEWVRGTGDRVDHKSWQARALESFSGQIALDEVYDGEWCQLKATDPVNGMELAWWLHEGSADGEVVKNFLEGLKAAGFMPQLVVTDGSTLYPKVIKEVWPGAEHQRCVFHFMMQMNKLLGKAFWLLYNAMPEPPKRPRGRPKKRGRKRKDKVKRLNRRIAKNARYLVLMRQGTSKSGRPLMTDEQVAALKQAFDVCSGLKLLRRFVNRLHDLFSSETDSREDAERKRYEILQDAEFLASDALEKAMGLLRDDELFRKLTHYLDFEYAEKTSNHVERENREFRKRQKSHYRLRSLQSLCAMLDLLSTRHEITDRPRMIRRKTPPNLGNEKEARQAS